MDVQAVNDKRHSTFDIAAASLAPFFAYQPEQHKRRMGKLWSQMMTAHRELEEQLEAVTQARDMNNRLFNEAKSRQHQLEEQFEALRAAGRQAQRVAASREKLDSEVWAILEYALSDPPVIAGPWVPDVNSGTCARQLSNGKVQGCGCRPRSDPNERCGETTPVVEVRDA